jgi:hypothetical protein
MSSWLWPAALIEIILKMSIYLVFEHLMQLLLQERFFFKYQLLVKMAKLV